MQEQPTIEQPTTDQPTIEQPTTEQPSTEQPSNKNALHQPENPESPEKPDTPDTPESPDTPQPPHAPDFRLSEAFLSLAEDDQEAAGHWLDLILTQLTNNALTAETLQMVLHALHYDHDVAQAGIDGEVKGRNARIEELFEQKRKTADIHMLGGAIAHTPSTLPTDIIGGLSAADRQTIWERGNEKRVILR